MDIENKDGALDLIDTEVLARMQTVHSKDVVSEPNKKLDEASQQQKKFDKQAIGDGSDGSFQPHISDSD